MSKRPSTQCTKNTAIDFLIRPLRGDNLTGISRRYKRRKLRPSSVRQPLDRPLVDHRGMTSGYSRGRTTLVFGSMWAHSDHEVEGFFTVRDCIVISGGISLTVPTFPPLILLRVFLFRFFKLVQIDKGFNNS